MARPDWLDQKLGEVKERATLDVERARAMEAGRIAETERLVGEQIARNRAFHEEARRSNPLWIEIESEMVQIRTLQQAQWPELQKLVHELGISSLLHQVEEALPGARHAISLIEYAPEALPISTEEILAEIDRRRKSQKEDQYAYLSDPFGKHSQPPLGIAYQLSTLLEYRTSRKVEWPSMTGRLIISERDGGYSGGRPSTSTVFKDHYFRNDFTVGISQFKASERPYLFYENSYIIGSIEPGRSEPKDPDRKIGPVGVSAQWFCKNPLELEGVIQYDYLKQPIGFKPPEWGNISRPRDSVGIIGFVDDIDQSVEAVQLAIAGMVGSLPPQAFVHRAASREQGSLSRVGRIFSRRSK